MKTLNRENCAVLHLGLRRHWYDMIDNGTKCIEFREAKPYWKSRIDNWLEKFHVGKIPVLEFQCGYSRFSPRMTFIAGDGKGTFYDYRLDDTPIEHKELGEFPKNRYVLFIGERCELITKSEGE